MSSYLDDDVTLDTLVSNKFATDVLFLPGCFGFRA